MDVVAADAPPPTLSGLRVLVVEDHFLQAEEFCASLRENQCTIVGPAPGLEAGLELALRQDLDIAALDINLSGKLSFPIARILRERRIPFFFVSGYEASILPDEFRSNLLLAKPFGMGALAGAVRHCLHDAA